MPESESRIIKKYPNRRLYDTAISSYITLADVKTLVLEQIPFSVQDARTGEDLTRTILLQIILEQEEHGEPIFTCNALQQIIRFYDGTMPALVGNYLEKSFKLLTEQQHGMNSQMREMMTKTPLTYMTELAEQNFKLWKEIQESFFQAVLGNDRHADKDKE